MTATNPYLRLELELRTEGAPGDPDPRHHGMAATVVRRALGRALVERFCPFGEPRCQPRGGGRVAGELCDLEASCPYGVLYAARQGRPPFALHVPPPRGETGSIEVTSYGPACRLYPWLVATLAGACRRGLGKERRRWDLREVLYVHGDRSRERLCGGDVTELTSVLNPRELPLGDAPAVGARSVAVTFLSPLRLLRDGKLLPGDEPVPLALLVARILDRLQGVYGASASELLEPAKRREWEAAASRVEVVSDDTRWVEVEDYSARKGSELLLGGKVGRTVYAPEAAPFLPILRAGEILHVGKNPTAGCGRMAVDFVG